MNNIKAYRNNQSQPVSIWEITTRSIIATTPPICNEAILATIKLADQNSPSQKPLNYNFNQALIRDSRSKSSLAPNFGEDGQTKASITCVQTIPQSPRKKVLEVPLNGVQAIARIWADDSYQRHECSFLFWNIRH